MAVRINRIVFPTALLVSLLLLLSAYVVVGVELLRHTRRSDTAEWWFYLQWLLLLASPVPIWRNLGGMLGAIALLLVSFFHIGWLYTLIAGGLGGTLAWFALRESDPVRDRDRALYWWEWLAGAGMAGWGLAVGLAMFNTSRLYYITRPDWLYTLWAGLLSYALAVTGVQMQLAEIPQRMGIITLTVVMVLGVVSGWIYGMVTILREAYT